MHPMHPMHPSFQSLTSHKKKKKLHFLHFLHLKNFRQTCLKARLPRHFGDIATLYPVMEPLQKNAQALFSHKSADCHRTIVRQKVKQVVLLTNGGSKFSYSASIESKTSCFTSEQCLQLCLTRHCRNEIPCSLSILTLRILRW